MGLTKSESFSKEQNAIATLAKGFAHPARIAILDFLLKSESCITGNLVNELPLSQSTVSQHLKELKQIGLIQGTIEGTSVCYCINEENWNIAKSVFTDFFNRFSIDKQCC